jgi:hypothetical protein
VGWQLWVHGGGPWVTEHPSTEARHEEEDHQGNRRDSEVTICALRSSRASYSSLSFHSYSPVSESDRPIISGEYKGKMASFLPLLGFKPNVGSELKFREHTEPATPPSTVCAPHALLQQNLDEEKATDKKLTAMAESRVPPRRVAA